MWIRVGVGRDLFGRQYEYEEDLTIGIDGSGTLTINASLAALNTLRGLDVDPLASSVDRDRIRALYQSNVARVRSVPRPWSRDGRQFVQINLEFDDVRRLSEDAPLSWSRYELTDQNGQHLFRQTVGAVGAEARHAQERRLGRQRDRRLPAAPARAASSNTTRAISRRTSRPASTAATSSDGNSTWPIASTASPLTIEVRMDSQSILYRTLFLFAGRLHRRRADAGLLIWWTIRRAEEITRL